MKRFFTKLKEKDLGPGYAGKPWEVIKQLTPNPLVCKTCKKNPRRNGSAYCQGCTNDYFKQLIKQ